MDLWIRRDREGFYSNLYYATSSNMASMCSPYRPQAEVAPGLGGGAALSASVAVGSGGAALAICNTRESVRNQDPLREAEHALGRAALTRRSSARRSLLLMAAAAGTHSRRYLIAHWRCGDAIVAIR